MPGRDASGVERAPGTALVRWRFQRYVHDQQQATSPTSPDHSETRASTSPFASQFQPTGAGRGSESRRLHEKPRDAEVGRKGQHLLR